MSFATSFIQFKLFLTSTEYRNAIISLKKFAFRMKIARGLSEGLPEVAKLILNGECKNLSRADTALTQRAFVAKMIGWPELSNLFLNARENLRDGYGDLALNAIRVVLSIYDTPTAEA